MESKNLYSTIAQSAVFTAIVFVFTFIIRIPVPATGGYYNIGESGVYLAALLGGPIVGAVAGGLGSALADVVSGYFIYAPATFIIKSLEGFIVGYMFRTLVRNQLNLKLSSALSCLLGGTIMVTGYLLYETFLINFASALIEVPVNIGQVLIGLIVAIPVLLVLKEMGFDVES